MARTGSKALNRGLDILFALSESNTVLSVDELAERVSIPESTIYRLLQTLEGRGLIHRHSPGRVGLGPAILTLARATRKQIESDLVEIARPFMQDLTARTGETSLLSFRIGLHGVCVESVDPGRPISLQGEKGKVFPLYSGASALALLARLEPDTIEQVIAAGQGKQHAHGGEVTREALENTIARIRHEGYVVTIGERDAWAAGIGVPILDAQGNVLASFCLAGPKDRFSDDVLPGLIEAAVKTARAIEDRLKRVAP
jgi:DNA-binding IclR family transcriptional regulator